MSRIFWDSMLFIYLLEDHPTYADRVAELLDRSYRRGDSLFTSYLVLGELVAGTGKASPSPKGAAIPSIIEEMGFSFLPFDSRAVQPFGALRAGEKLAIADTIHLACAAAAKIDLFLTNDKRLTKLDVPGIQFIANFDAPIL